MRRWLSIAGTLTLLGTITCSEDATAPGGDGPVSVLDALPGDGARLGDGIQADSAWGNNQPACAGQVYACGDGVDNDKDGKTDAEDPECVGPCDNDEASFGTGIPGDNVDACKQDCFFDGNSGAGDDGCEWNLKCDPKSPGANLAKACPYDAGYKNCEASQPQLCKDTCLARTPNGCDCFGCCTVYAGGKALTVFLGSGPGCSTAAPQNCASCTPVTSCLNPCEECEICLGRTMADLPASCFPVADGGISKDGGIRDGGTTPLPKCPTGVTPCLTHADCQTGYFCLTGCCIKGID